MARRGRPSKLTAETKAQLLEGVRAGLSYKLACADAGIHYNTLRNWVKRGEGAKNGEFLEFLEDLKRAEGGGAKRLVGLIQRSANEGHWKAAAWILERRYPETYGRKRFSGGAAREKPNAPQRPAREAAARERTERDAHLAELRWIRESASERGEYALALRSLEIEARVMGFTAEGAGVDKLADTFLAGVHNVKSIAPEDLSE